MATREELKRWAGLLRAGESELESDQLDAEGNPAAGVRLFEDPGTTYGGIDVPAGTVEVFGVRVEFSEMATAQGELDPVTYANFSTDDADNTLVAGQSVQFSIDATNPNASEVDTAVTLAEDGASVISKVVTIPAGGTVTVTFDVFKNDYDCWDYTCEGEGPIEVCWIPEGL